MTIPEIGPPPELIGAEHQEEDLDDSDVDGAKDLEDAAVTNAVEDKLKVEEAEEQEEDPRSPQEIMDELLEHAFLQVCDWPLSIYTFQPF